MGSIKKKRWKRWHAVYHQENNQNSGPQNQSNTEWDIKTGRLQNDWWAGGTHELGSHSGDFIIGFIKMFKYNQYVNDLNQVIDENIEWFVYYNTKPTHQAKWNVYIYWYSA